MGTAITATPIKTIDLEGLSPEVARAFALMIETIKRQNAQAAFLKKNRVVFSAWPGKVVGDLTRKDIYGYLSGRVR